MHIACQRVPTQLPARLCSITCSTGMERRPYQGTVSYGASVGRRRPVLVAALAVLAQGPVGDHGGRRDHGVPSIGLRGHSTTFTSTSRVMLPLFAVFLLCPSPPRPRGTIEGRSGSEAFRLPTSIAGRVATGLVAA